MENIAVEQATQLIGEWQAGNEDSRDRLVTLFYPWLRRAAAGLLSDRAEISLSTGDLVHETAIRLFNADGGEWKDRAHFLAVASKAMRHVLIDHIRAKHANKRRHERVTLLTEMGNPQRIELSDLNHAMLRLAAIDPAKSDLVEMRYFGGMSIKDIAEVTGLSERTVKRRWRVTRAWLSRALATG